jgi:DegV family protein with EDD domain
MTPTRFEKAFHAGFDRLAAWSDLLDAINVFPVADGDTGRNLQVSLAPLKTYHAQTHADRLTAQLLRSARGNSGNIATQFFSEFIDTPATPMGKAAARGAQAAYRAVQSPRDGTILTVFDTLAAQLANRALPDDAAAVTDLLGHLQITVHDSRETLSRLRTAGVVDAGALGMYLFFEGFFLALIDRLEDCRPPSHSFPDSLKINAAFREQEDQGYCVDTILRTGPDIDTIIKELGAEAESVVTIARGDIIKLHFHTADREATRRTLEATGALVRWSEDDLAHQVKTFNRRGNEPRMHIVTDGAASLTRADQERYGFTLLDSYISAGDWSQPETRVDAQDLYHRMRSGEQVTTSQASVFERHQHYQRLLHAYPETLYLCVGSAFTGNYAAAAAWQARHDPQNRLKVIDSGAASGRLAVAVLAAARLACRGADRDTVRALAERSLTICREYIFIDRLKYLAAGGRLSRPSALVGDLLNVKPVISPLPTGAEKIGSVKNRSEQLQFALRQLRVDLADAAAPLILLEYSDNREWVEADVEGVIRKQFPEAEIILQPLSLTTGAHTGPGTWAVAVHPDPEGRLAIPLVEQSLKQFGKTTTHMERNRS